MRLVGRHIEFEPLTVEHVDALYEVGKSPRIWEFLQCRIESRSEMADWVADALRARDEKAEIPFVVRLRSDQSIVGATRLQDYFPEHRQIEIGLTWGSRNLWNGAYTIEGFLLHLRFCFEQLDMVRVQVTTDARNQGLRKMIERLGANLDGVLRKHRILPDGYVRDTAYYSFVDDEWPVVKRGLLELLASTACAPAPTLRGVGGETDRRGFGNGDHPTASL